MTLFLPQHLCYKYASLCDQQWCLVPISVDQVCSSLQIQVYWQVKYLVDITLYLTPGHYLCRIKVTKHLAWCRDWTPMNASTSGNLSLTALLYIVQFLATYALGITCLSSINKTFCLPIWFLAIWQKYWCSSMHSKCFGATLIWMCMLLSNIKISGMACWPNCCNRRACVCHLRESSDHLE